MMLSHEMSGKIRQCIKADKIMEKSPAAMVNLPRESMPYLPYIKRINFSFKIYASLIG